MSSHRLKDRFVAIQLKCSSSEVLSFVGVYLPSSDHPLDMFREYPTELKALLKFTRESDCPYHCLYDLEKAFYTIEHATLLLSLYKRGINGNELDTDKELVYIQTHKVW